MEQAYSYNLGACTGHFSLKQPVICRVGHQSQICLCMLVAADACSDTDGVTATETTVHLLQ